MKIILFGGSFDPVHKQHIAMAVQAKRFLNADEVWLIPTKIPPLKSRVLTPAMHRVAMLKLATKPYPWMKVKTIEIRQAGNGPSYTCNTVAKLKARYPNDQFFLILGADQINQFPRWKRPKALSEAVNLVGIIRNGVEIDPQIVKNYNIKMLPVYPKTVSSSKLRRGIDNKTQLDPDVLDYINSHLLYVNERLKEQMAGPRILHSINVGQTAFKLAKIWNVNSTHAQIAGIYHDIAKQWPPAQMRNYMRWMWTRMIREPEPVWHGFAGAQFLAREYGFNNEAILNAVAYHTTPRPKPTKLEMIIYIADKIEPGRHYREANKLRALAETNLEEAFKACLFIQTVYIVKKRGISNIGKQLLKTFETYFSLADLNKALQE